MNSLQHLEAVLQKSLQRNGDVPVTIGHLLNIVKMTRKSEQDTADIYDELCKDIMNEVDPLCQEPA